MLERVRNIIIWNKLIDKGDNIVIGNSGGPDSIFLFTIMYKLKDDLNFNIYNVHVNHGVRGEEAKADEVFVKDLSERLKVPFYSKSFDMVQHAKDRGITEEEAGREIRYTYFNQVLEEIGGGKIGLGHNKNDQAETLLMRFLRGTAIDGLKGMDIGGNSIIRPILHISRDEIEAYLHENNIPYRIDKTNLQPIYQRNKIRLELLPYLEKEYNPNLIETLWRTSKISARDSNFLNKMAEARYKQVVNQEESGKILFNRARFLEEDLSMQARILRLGLEKLLGNLQGFTESHIDIALDFIKEARTGKSIDLLQNTLVKNIYEDFLIELNGDKESIDFHTKFHVNKDIIIPQLGYIFNSEIISNMGQLNHKDLYTKYFDYDKIKGSIFIRGRKDGDYIIPFGMKGRKKLKDLFIDKKIPKEERDIIPLIVDDESILWVVGLQTNDKYRIDTNTKSILKISFRRTLNGKYN